MSTMCVECADRRRALLEAPLPKGPAPSPSRRSPAVPPSLAGHCKIDIKGGVRRGLECSGGGRVDERLAVLVRAGKLPGVSFDDIDTFQRIANVESGGKVQALNTWDTGVVSLGFIQLTLRYGELQRWIARAPRAFGRYGIAIDPTRRYPFTENGKQVWLPAIAGAPTAQELRWSPWAERFFAAGLDDDVIVAQVQVGLERHAKHLDVVRKAVKHVPGAFNELMRHYRASPYVRAVFQESYNNRPAYTRKGTINALRQAIARGQTTTAQFTQLLLDGIGAAYVSAGKTTKQVKELRGKAEHIFTRTRVGARPGLLSGVGASPSGAPGGTPPTTATAPAGSWDSVRVGPGDIVTVGGIQVHRMIADRVRRMIDAAAADGVTLSGGGYRSSASQIALRRKNCGPTDYDIYQKPPKQCRTPTARPGRSRHEQGLAIDFHLQRRPGALAWLRANAARFGFVNLPSEAWHWSVDGR